jgi:WhiB family transcriptional regulator, redox-sensing transcriptional regulator
MRAIDWRNQAGCLDVDPEIFYPLDLDPTGPAVLTAKRICAACPVRSACLDDVMALEQPGRRWGVSAGLTPGERTALYLAARPAGAGLGAVAA